jgi:hypothetical protein
MPERDHRTKQRIIFRVAMYAGGMAILWGLLPRDRWSWFIRKSSELNTKSPLGGVGRACRRSRAPLAVFDGSLVSNRPRVPKP